MKQILFALLLCVSSICSAQNTVSKSPDKPQYFYASFLHCDSFYLGIREWSDSVVDCDEPLCNILRFKRIKDNEMLLIGDKQNYRLIADYPFKLEWRKINKGSSHVFELLGLRAYVPDYNSGMTISAKIEDSNKKAIFYREYRTLRVVDLYVEYVGKDQKTYIDNLKCGWPKNDFDPQNDIRFFLKERGGDTMYPILKMSFKRFDCFDCLLPDNEGGSLSENLRRRFASRDLGKTLFKVDFKDGTGVSRKYQTIYIKRKNGK